MWLDRTTFVNPKTSQPRPEAFKTQNGGVCLTDPEANAAYDAQLRGSGGAAQASPAAGQAKSYLKSRQKKQQKAEWQQGQFSQPTIDSVCEELFHGDEAETKLRIVQGRHYGKYVQSGENLDCTKADEDEYRFQVPSTHGQKFRVFTQASELIDQLKGAANGAADRHDQPQAPGLQFPRHAHAKDVGLRPEGRRRTEGQSIRGQRKTQAGQ